MHRLLPCLVLLGFAMTPNRVDAASQLRACAGQDISDSAQQYCEGYAEGLRWTADQMMQQMRAQGLEVTCNLPKILATVRAQARALARGSGGETVRMADTEATTSNRMAVLTQRVLAEICKF